MNRNILSTPEYGWTDLMIGKYLYGLSFLTDVPHEWIENAIFGLEHAVPFAVHGFCEPNRMICLVDYYNCHIIYETDGDFELVGDGAPDYNTVHIGMYEFCRGLYEDISNDLDKWADWGPSFWEDEYEVEEHHKMNVADLQEKLGRLKEQLEEWEKKGSMVSYF